ncbi:UNKNOWN [Stylonychia lemnae]|uniref:Homeobox domain-containing protein n=1 Tax=Stylonychia lemnae TaxID=5949 RepID=A0A077ZQ61_STYLE|nr:UNKNOWN [Stylonychia lemnae]|eukprot:CDW72043.1 UNKNOWN [Stylonychia lemnae]
MQNFQFDQVSIDPNFFLRMPKQNYAIIYKDCDDIDDIYESIQGSPDICQNKLSVFNLNQEKDHHHLSPQQIKPTILHQKSLFLTKVSKKKEKSDVKRNSFTRHQKNKQQIKILEIEFSKEKSWSRKLIEDLSLRLDLTPTQIYKWYYDKINYKSKRKNRQSSELTQ